MGKILAILLTCSASILGAMYKEDDEWLRIQVEEKYEKSALKLIAQGANIHQRDIFGIGLLDIARAGQLACLTKVLEDFGVTASKSLSIHIPLELTDKERTVSEQTRDKRLKCAARNLFLKKSSYSSLRTAYTDVIIYY